MSASLITSFMTWYCKNSILKKKILRNYYWQSNTFRKMINFFYNDYLNKSIANLILVNPTSLMARPITVRPIKLTKPAKQKHSYTSKNGDNKQAKNRVWQLF